MFKIKLSILLLISLILISCSNNNINNNNEKFSVGYISGEIDGLILKNLVVTYLQNLNMYDQNSDKKIQLSINHAQDLFITNIDNTSDRENIETRIYAKVFDNKNNCETFNKNYQIKQFYIFASSDKFLSNQTAVKKIKTENTEKLVKDFIYDLNLQDMVCYE